MCVVFQFSIELQLLVDYSDNQLIMHVSFMSFFRLNCPNVPVLAAFL